jgi:glycosyltransferase involved in cell wall biosynthesis
MISVTILTKNSEKYLSRILETLRPFNEVIILDSGSEDDTIKIAQSFENVVIHRQPFIGFGASHNLASSFAKNDWILSIDSDEIPTNELIAEILSQPFEKKTVYAFSRKNFYRGKFIKGCGWHPDFVVRLYNKKETKFSDDLVHEAVLTKGLKIKRLSALCHHYPYRSIDDFLQKMQNYSSLFAKQYQKRRKASFPKAALHGTCAFLKSYIVKKGFMLGSQGFEISFYNGATAFYKYLKLRDLNSQ